jgi:3-deoxy-manno-octulosonate cytidylyltransferase (CMP-KDO synthetase)
MYGTISRGKILARVSPLSMTQNSQPSVIVVIPARHASTRFPGKPLASIAGRPMIQHVYERAKQSQRASRVIVATDDNRIREAVQSFGGEVIMTRSEHRTGTDRLAEVAVHIPADIYVNVQGDLPLILPEVIDAVVDALVSPGDDAQVSTLCVPITTPEDIMNPNVVKVVSDFDGNALYFSRAPVPWVRDAGERVAARHFKHVGLYAFRRDALLEFPALPPGDLERVEQLEQLRWMENGYRIAVAEGAYEGVEVDVPADVPRVEELLRGRAAKP